MWSDADHELLFIWPPRALFCKRCGRRDRSLAHPDVFACCFLRLTTRCVLSIPKPYSCSTSLPMYLSMSFCPILGARMRYFLTISVSLMHQRWLGTTRSRGAASRLRRTVSSGHGSILAALTKRAARNYQKQSTQCTSGTGMLPLVMRIWQMLWRQAGAPILALQRLHATTCLECLRTLVGSHGDGLSKNCLLPPLSSFTLEAGSALDQGPS